MIEDFLQWIMWSAPPTPTTPRPLPQVLAPKNLDARDKELLRMDVMDAQLDAIGKAVLGLTIGVSVRGTTPLAFDGLA
jgi:hypothetical protein